MKQGEIIITAILTILAFIFGFLNNTNSSPKLEHSPTNSTLDVIGSSTNEEQNLGMIAFDLEKVENIETDSLVNDTIVLESSQTENEEQ